MRKRDGGTSKRSVSSSKSPGVHSRRNRGSTANEERSRVNGREGKRELGPYREYPGKSGNSILESAALRGAGAMEDGITLKTNSEVKEIAKSLPTPWGNHRFLLILTILAMILVTLGTGMIRSYILEKNIPEGGWGDYLRKEHKRQDKQFHMLYQHLERQGCKNCDSAEKKGK